MNQSLASAQPLYSIFGIDPDLEELVEIFVEELPHRLASFRDLLARGEWDALGRAAHQLKGSVGSYGFDQLTPSLQRLESLAKERAPAAIELALSEVVEICGRVRAGVAG